MTLIYYYKNGEKQSVHGKNEMDCVRKMQSKNSEIVRVERIRSEMEKVTG